MALGFGFNKTKVLQSAEKYVQQGKLQNAINEYQKVVKQDPKDLTVLNTIGDCYARLGQNDQALVFFRRVGDTYAADGFVVKAIAMYKKITKLSPGTHECILKLAELYTQQGLYNDARQQYVQVADHFVRANDLDQATAVFQKMLELDPENASVRSKLADVYLRMGRKDQAREIFLGAAESLYKRGTLDAAEQALERVLSLDPHNSGALMLRARVAADSGQNARAIDTLERIADLDSRPEALQLLLRVTLADGLMEQARPLAQKLLTIHNNPAGLAACAQAMFAARQYADALRLYSENTEVLSSNQPEVMQSLQGIISQIKEDAPALELLRGIYQRVGESTNMAEVTELLAHAWVQAGEFAKARDLYQHLASIEPENPSHAQSYKQMMERLGEDPSLRSMTREEGAQAFMVDELQTAGAEAGVAYSAEVESAVTAALTDSELFDSYNMPAKAIAPLEAVLDQAPLHLQLNQRLASLYERAERYADAARCCEVLQQAYARAGDEHQATQYAELVARNRERAGTAVQEAPVQEMPVQELPVQEISVETAPAEEVAVEPQAAAAAAGSEWDSMLTVEAEPAAEATAQFVGSDAVAAASSAVLGELLQEARFYLSQSMWKQAGDTLDKCAELDAASPDVAELRAQLSTALAPAPAAAPEAIPEPEPAEPQAVSLEAAAAPEAAAPADAAPVDALSDLVMDLEDALPEDFGGAARPSAPPPAAAPPPSAASAPAPMAAASPAEAATSQVDSALSDMFAEFKEEVEDPSAAEAEDPDTHYNLGVAFKEMGLLDEAIGELQKVVHAIDRGHSFSQVIQAYTWLANCFVEKGVPEASIKWYQKALQVSGIDEQTRTALHYDMGSAYEAAGDRAAALRAFTEAYGSNIDYRDVAERIKALKS